MSFVLLFQHPCSLTDYFSMVVTLLWAGVWTRRGTLQSGLAGSLLSATPGLPAPLGFCILPRKRENNTKCTFTYYAFRVTSLFSCSLSLYKWDWTFYSCSFKNKYQDQKWNVRQMSCVTIMKLASENRHTLNDLRQTLMLPKHNQCQDVAWSHSAQSGFSSGSVNTEQCGRGQLP